MKLPEQAGVVPSSQRRRLLQMIPGGLVAAAVVGANPARALTSATNPHNTTTALPAGWHEAWVSAEGSDAEHFGLGWISPDLQQANSVLAGFRGHGMAQNPQQPAQVVMFSRAPGRELVVVDIQKQSVLKRIDCQPGYHLAGHGCFSADGRLLYSVESNYEKGSGQIVVRDTSSWAIVADYSSGGIGPHEVRLMPDQQTLVIANGGLLTHPDRKEEVLNLDSMDSSLVYMNGATGEILSQWRLPESKASIRHLDVAPDGTVAIATQVQRAAMHNNDLVALGAIHKPGQPLQLLAEPSMVLAQFDDYMGSVVINARERVAGFSSPRGNLVAFWNLDSLELAGYYRFHDVCGLACSRDQKHFVLSNSAGEVRLLDAASLKENRTLRMSWNDRHWDNHMNSLLVPDLHLSFRAAANPVTSA